MHFCPPLTGQYSFLSNRVHKLELSNGLMIPVQITYLGTMQHAQRIN